MQRSNERGIPSGINRISIVIPTYNEEQNLGELHTSLERQKKSFGRKHPQVDIQVIISDNGSTDATLEIANDIDTVVTGSEPRSRGSARRVGFEAAMDQYTGGASEHVIFSLDADTTMAHDDFLASSYEAFSQNPHLAVTHGPNLIQVTNGPLLEAPQAMMRVLQWMKIKSRFGMYGRSPGDFLHKPHNVVFPGFNFAVREDAYAETGGFSDDNSFAEDHWLSYHLKKNHTAPEILFNKEQLVITSGRALETPDGKLSVRRVTAGLVGRYASFGSDLPETRINSHSANAVKAFIDATESEAYDLSESQRVLGIVSKSELSALSGSGNIEEVKPAVIHTTGDIKPGRFAVIVNQ